MLHTPFYYYTHTNVDLLGVVYIIEYSDICTIVPQIFRNLYEHVTNVFNMRVSVLIDNRLYTCKISAYDIEYLSGACLLARLGHALVVH